jgi:DNA-binding transcriptional ArsR family regulator
MGFAALPSDLVRDPSLPVAAKGVLLVLSSYANRDNECWPGIETIAGAIGLSGRQTQTHLRRLEQDGYVITVRRKSERGGNLPNVYKLNFNRWGSGQKEESCTPPRKNPSPPGEASITTLVKPTSPKQDQANKTKEHNHPLPPQGGELFPAEPKAKRKKTVAQAPPSLDVVAAYFASKGSNRDQAERFHDYWTDQGWARRAGPMRSWEGSARTWMKNNKDGNNNKRQPAHTKAHDYDNDPDFAGKEW